MCGKTNSYKIRNDNIIVSVEVVHIIEKIVENILRWFGYIERINVNYILRRVYQIERSKITKDRGKHIKIIREITKIDIEIKDFDISIVFDITL